jgi:calcium-binding protein CML
MDVLMESSWTGSARFQRAPSLTAKDVIDLPPPLLREISDSFQFFDRNGDGKISQDELAAVIRSLGQPVSASEIQSLIDDVDANGDGFIDLYEFIDLNTRPTSGSDSESELSDDEALASAFGVFDADKNGFISANELQRVLVAFGDSMVTMEECRLMIESVDEDGDEMVDFREFVSLMNRRLEY